MEQDVTSAIERGLLRDKRAYFRGTAKVRFENLDLDKLCPRRYDSKAVAYLADKFKTQGLLRMEPRNRIPGLIDAKALEDAIDSSPLASLETLLDNPNGEPPELQLPNCLKIECLQGLHRVEACRKVLAPKDWWWTVDLYLSDANNDLQTILSQEYSDSVNFTDGEIFLAVRSYHHDAEIQLGTLFAERCVWARLSFSKRKDLKQILNHDAFTKALDGLRTLPGLWAGFRIEHKFMSMKCDEEILHYLHHIKTFWTALLGDRKELMQYVDRGTVEFLQLRVPGVSHADLRIIEKAFRKKILFPGIRDEHDRLAIWDKLRVSTCLIPSMYTLFEDIKYLKAPAKILRSLFPKTTSTTYEVMSQSVFSGRNQKNNTYSIQVSEQSFREERGQRIDQLEIGYRQLWLKAWRDTFQLGPDCPKKEDGKPTPMPQESNTTKWFELATLAAELGFESKEINYLLSSDPDRKLAKETLLRARDPEHFSYGERAFNTYLDQMVAIFKSAEKARDDNHAIDDQADEDLERRCGRVYEKAHENTRKYLFLDTIRYQQNGDGKAVSSIFVRASVYFAFFANHDITNPSSGADEPTTSPAQPDGASTPIDRGTTTLSNTVTTHLSGTDEPTASPVEPNGAPAAIDRGTIITLDQVSDPVTNSQSGTDPTASPLVDLSIAVTETINRVVEPYHNQVTQIAPARIFMKLWENNNLVDQDRPLKMDREEVMRTMKKKERRGYRLFDTFGRALHYHNCFDAVVQNGTRTIVLAKASDIDINPQLLLATANALEQQNGQKRLRIE